MISERFRRTATRTFVLDQSVDRVFKALVDPQAAHWLVAQCAYTVPAPGPTGAVGALRCCWLDRVRRGVRQVTVLELVTARQDERVQYVDRSERITGSSNLDFRLTAEGASTRVELTAAAGRHEKLLEERLRAAVSGRVRAPANPQIVTLAAGAGAKKQVHEIVISAPPKRLWKLLNDADPISDPTRVAGWHARIEDFEFKYSISRQPDNSLRCLVTRVIPQGTFHLTTVDSTGMEIEQQLLPHEDACLLRTTYRWTIPIRSRAVREAARARQSQLKVLAEAAQDAS